MWIPNLVMWNSSLNSIPRIQTDRNIFGLCELLSIIKPQVATFMNLVMLKRICTLFVSHCLIFFSHCVNWKKNICKRVVRRQIMDSVELQIFFWEFLSTNIYRYWTVKFMEYTHIFFLFQNSAICLNTKRQNCAFYESWNIKVHIFHLSSLNNLHLFPKRLSSVNVELNQHLPSKSIFNRKFFNVQGNL